MVIITLGNGVEFVIGYDNEMSIRKMVRGEPTQEILLGDATVENFDRIVENMSRLKIHMK